MRADRLLTILMLLQKNGKMTAARLAKETEVSVRTIYRDVAALSSAGIPVYTEDGPGGGIALVEQYRSGLTGLSRDEARALALVGIPEPLIQLGLGPQLKTALLKVAAAQLASARTDSARAAGADITPQAARIHLDPGWGFQPGGTPPHLSTLYAALTACRRLMVTFRTSFDVEISLDIAPYGLVAWANTWYLVGEERGRIRALKVGEITEVEPLEQSVDVPRDFDLAGFWKEWRQVNERHRPAYPVTARIAPGVALWIKALFGREAGDILAQAGPPDDRGWRQVVLPFEMFETARTSLLGLGGSVEVLEPLALRMSVADYASQVVRRYSDRDPENVEK